MKEELINYFNEVNATGSEEKYLIIYYHLMKDLE